MSVLGDLSRDVGFAMTVMRRRPFSVLIQVTNRCNMKCDFCDFWANGAPPREELTLADYEDLERQLTKQGRFIISLEGGEPFVRKDILDIVKIFSRRHITVLYTNGWYINPENAQQLFDNGLSQIGVSIDYPQAARHDAKRCLEGATERAWKAVELLREAAPHKGRQVHVMTVYMEENRRDFEELLRQSQEKGVGHAITLLSTYGFRRSKGGSWPEESISKELLRLWKSYPHFRVFRDYLALMDPFLSPEKVDMPECGAGRQSFNVDHLGNIAPCIEKIGKPVGNVREEPLEEILLRSKKLDSVSKCQDCWTLCRGISQVMGKGGSLRGWIDLSTRMRSR